MPSVFFYISGHGFGHASRQIEIINALGAARRAPVDIVVRTSAQRWLFDRTVTAPFTFVEGDVDTGVAQIDSLRLDEAESIRRAARFHESLVERAGVEAGLLRSHDARLVVSDAPALACAAAAAAGVPSVVCSNFTWDWIYDAYAHASADTQDLVARIQEAYAKAQAAWRLPMHGGFTSFVNIVDMPFIARHATWNRDDVWRRFGVPSDRPVALSSFGGYGLDDFDPAALDCLDAVSVVITGRGAARSVPAGVYFVDESTLYDGGPRYEDLVAAVDVVVTKPGYGIISECIANGAAILYTSRGHFVEYDVLVREMPRYLRCQFIPQRDLLAGRWRQMLEELLRQPAPPEKAATNGADIAANEIVRSVT